MSDPIDGKLQRAFNFLEEGRLKQAEIVYLECLDKLTDKQSNDYKQALHGLGFVKSQLKDFTDANEIYLELLRRAEKGRNTQDEALAYHQLGMVKRLAGQYHQALSLFKEAQTRYLVDEPHFSLELAVNVYEQGIVYVAQEQWGAAYYLLMKSLDYAQKTKDYSLMGQINQELANITATVRDSQTAGQFYQQAMKAFQQSGDDKAQKKLQSEFND